MGLLTQSQQTYYQGSSFGNYQFVNLTSIIDNFMATYIGEGKILTDTKRNDVSFHAHRALAELSFDTFKSTKSQELTLPPSLTMILPQDYVNYTKISWSDSSGIKHPLYPTNSTSNPTNPYQTVATFDIKAIGTIIAGGNTMTLDAQYDNILVGMAVSGIGIVSGTLVEASAVSGGITTLKLDTNLDMTFEGTPATTVTNAEFTFTAVDGSLIQTPNTQVLNEGGEILNARAFIDFQTALTGVSVGDLVSHEFFPVGTVITSIVSDPSTTPVGAIGTRIYVSNQAVSTIGDGTALGSFTNAITFTSTSPTSDTWNNYKGNISSGNQDDYIDDTYWPAGGERYGLDPQHAQVNGSFFIDELKGLIHFSSNISGKTVVLDYISDSLGTDNEMQVHKLAEEAIYKHIMYGCVSAKLNVPEYIINRFRRERFAETRKAKLRLSNIKIEEITQILRGKSKQIKH
jgi:hypothetical protein